jgi:hypothetical protein
MKERTVGDCGPYEESVRSPLHGATGRDVGGDTIADGDSFLNREGALILDTVADDGWTNLIPERRKPQHERARSLRRCCGRGEHHDQSKGGDPTVD